MILPHFTVICVTFPAQIYSRHTGLYCTRGLVKKRIWRKSKFYSFFLLEFFVIITLLPTLIT